ncbi:MAG: uncharacterized protein JWP59_1329 [Massilia sp.]|nr:uncharacterized protein [Massilia sp.]
MRFRSFAAMTVISTALAASMLAAPSAALAQAQTQAQAQAQSGEPTIAQVREAAEAGKFIEAQKMMDQVLALHPASAKAHFIEAELLAKQGKMTRAAAELASAERLAPGLGFAKPEAVRQLRQVIAQGRPAAAPAASSSLAPADSVRQAQPAEASGLPWGMIFGIGVLVLLAVMFFKRKAARPLGGSAGGWSGPGQAPVNGVGGYPSYPSGGAQPGGMGGMGGLGSGMGGNIVGGLATGAALGAGMVAGQALAHRLGGADGAQPQAGAAGRDDGLTSGAFADNDVPPAGYDMGGSDFGVDDAGSWDGGGGGNDWD